MIPREAWLFLVRSALDRPQAEVLPFVLTGISKPRLVPKLTSLKLAMQRVLLLVGGAL